MGVLPEDQQTLHRVYLDKLNSLLAKIGVSPHNFAAKIISDVQKEEQTSSSAIVEGMGIVNPVGDIWKLAEVPGINPEFLQALECGKRAMKDFHATGSKAAVIQACNCRKNADGSYILAFAAKPADQAKSTELGGKTQLNVGGLTQKRSS